MTSGSPRDLLPSPGILCAAFLIVVSVSWAGCLGDSRTCTLNKAGESWVEQNDPTFQNLTQEDVDRYPILLDIVQAEGYASFEVDCDHQQEVWTYLDEEGYVEHNIETPTAWVAWQGERAGIGLGEQIS